MPSKQYAIISTSYFVGLIVMYVGTSELHFCSPHWIQKYLNPTKLSVCAKPPYLILPPCIPCFLFYPSPCIPSPYSIPSPCIPSPYSIPSHAYPAPYSIPAHAYPAPYSIPAHAYPAPYSIIIPSPCIPSPYSIPPHAYAPPILSQLMHTFPLFYPTHGGKLVWKLLAGHFCLQ